MGKGGLFQHGFNGFPKTYADLLSHVIFKNDYQKSVYARTSPVTQYPRNGVASNGGRRRLLILTSVHQHYTTRCRINDRLNIQRTPQACAPRSVAQKFFQFPSTGHIDTNTLSQLITTNLSYYKNTTSLSQVTAPTNMSMSCNYLPNMPPKPTAIPSSLQLRLVLE